MNVVANIFHNYIFSCNWKWIKCDYPVPVFPFLYCTRYEKSKIYRTKGTGDLQKNSTGEVAKIAPPTLFKKTVRPPRLGDDLIE
jgi:hypothetical protein